MTYAYVWVVIAVVQVAFGVMVALLDYVERDRVTADREGVSLSHDAITRLSTSRFWWRRMQAARALSAVAGPTDRPAIRRLLLDSHPAVQSAAASCLLRHADEELVSLVIDRLATRSTAVRMYQISVLRRRRGFAVPLLLQRLRSEAAPAQLHACIQLAEALDAPECVDRVAALSIHPNPEVRVEVARVLQRLRDDAGVIKLLTMLRDPDWRVRAQAARSLGVQRDERAVAELARALTDQTWWVRFRAGLALAALGDAGRKALAEARELPDRYARDMAAFVAGLSAPSVIELSEG